MQQGEPSQTAMGVAGMRAAESILVPFLVFAIAISHGVQMVGATRSEVFLGSSSEDAARKSFRRLLIPGGIALASDTIGFITILLIKIQIFLEMAVSSFLGFFFSIFLAGC